VPVAAVTARHQLRANLQPMVSEVVRKFIDTHAVDARRAFVLAYLFEGTLQIGAFQHLVKQRGGRNRLGHVALSSSGFMPRVYRGRHEPVVRCTPATLHLRPSSSIVRAFGRGRPTYYAFC
jgi:hypothetical protein